MCKFLRDIFMLFLKIFFPESMFKIGSTQLHMSAGVFKDVREILPLLKARKGVQ